MLEIDEHSRYGHSVSKLLVNRFVSFVIFDGDDTTVE